MSGRDYRDDVIEALAASEEALIEQLQTLAERAVVAEASLEAMRLVAVAGIHHAHALGAELDRLTDRYVRLLDDARGLRLRLLQVDDRQVAA